MTRIHDGGLGGAVINCRLKAPTPPSPTSGPAGEGVRREAGTGGDLPCLAAARRAGRGSAVAEGALLGLVLVEHRLGRSLALGAELGAVIAAPLIGGGARLVQLAEMRHHIAGVELVG